MFDADRLAWVQALVERVSRRQALAGVLGMAALALAEDAEAKKKRRKKKKNKRKRRKKKNRAKDRNQQQEPDQNGNCPAGQTACDDQCRDLSSDKEHCGECWESCYGSQICRSGVCTVPCSEHACFTRMFPGNFRGSSVALMPDGNLAVLGGDEQIGIFDSSGTLVRTIGEFGTEEGEFDNASDLAVGPYGTIYVADSGNDRVQMLLSNGDIFLIPIDYPTEIAVGPTGVLYTESNSQIGCLLATGEVSYAWGPDGTDQSYFDYLADISVAGDGAIYALSSSDGKVYRFADDGSGNITVTWDAGGRGVDPGEFRAPAAIAAAGNRVFVADGNGNSARVHVLDAADGSFLFRFPITDNDGWGLYPEDIAVDGAGNVYIADWGIYVYTLKS